MYADDTTIYFNLEDFPIEIREVLITGMGFFRFFLGHLGHS